MGAMGIGITLMTVRTGFRGRSPEAQKWRRLYKTKRWRELRKAHLARHPLCQCPHHKERDTAALATVVDHAVAHKGDPKKFWNRAALRSMTKECHDRFAQSRDKGGAGFLKGCGPNGEPLSDDHPWYN